jgi:hypothetical protein
VIRPTIGFIVYGVHKDGLQDPMGKPFIDEALIAEANDALCGAGLELVAGSRSSRTRGVTRPFPRRRCFQILQHELSAFV